MSRLDLPKISKIGDFVVETSDTAFDCAQYYKWRNASVITGYYSCQGEAYATSTSGAGRIVLKIGHMVLLISAAGTISMF